MSPENVEIVRRIYDAATEVQHVLRGGGDLGQHEWLSLWHPECTLEVVRTSDLNGSTEFIISTVRAAPSGTTWAVGTEINLVSRLATEMPDKKIFCLDPQVCPCSTMYRMHPSFLLWSLESLSRGEIRNEVKVPERVAVPARAALDRMLSLAPEHTSVAG